MRPDKLPNCDVDVSGSRLQRIDSGWVNTACYVAVPFTSVRFGDAPRVDGDIRLDPIFNWDLSIAKRIPVASRTRLEFTAEIYNLFNRVRFGAPGNQVGTPLFGRVTTQVNQPRAMQFGLVSQEQATIETYVTAKALDGLYSMIAEQEQAFRRNPLAATSDIVRKVFGVLK